MGAHEGDAKTRRAAGDRRVAYRRYEKAEFFEGRACRKRPFLIAHDDGDDCRLTANRDSATRKFSDKESDILPQLCNAPRLGNKNLERGERRRHRWRTWRRREDERPRHVAKILYKKFRPAYETALQPKRLGKSPH